MSSSIASSCFKEDPVWDLSSAQALLIPAVAAGYYMSESNRFWLDVATGILIQLLLLLFAMTFVPHVLKGRTSTILPSCNNRILHYQDLKLMENKFLPWLNSRSKIEQIIAITKKTEGLRGNTYCDISLSSLSVDLLSCRLGKAIQNHCQYFDLLLMIANS
jgi:hypothetical protein